MNKMHAFLYYEQRSKPYSGLTFSYWTFYKEGNVYKLNNTILQPFLINLNLKNIILFIWDYHPVMQADLLRKDMCFFLYTWRLIRGYPKNGQSTHTNARSARKNKLLMFTRTEQFKLFFNKKKKYNFTNYILGEYTNRLWSRVWFTEWIQAMLFVYKLANKKTLRVSFDILKLAQNNTNGYTREGAAAKIGKAKQNFKSATIGLPVFFSRYIFTNKFQKDFPFLLATVTPERKQHKKKKRKKIKIF